MDGFEFRLQLGDSVLERYGNQLAQISQGDALKAFSRALNHEGDKTRTQVKRALVRQTGIKYNLVNKAMKTVRSTPKTLEYRLEARGDEANLGLFGARQLKKGISAAPWNQRRIFRGDNPARGSFFLPGTSLVYIRTGQARKPIEPLWGPNIARELTRENSPSIMEWAAYPPRLYDRISHELSRLLPV